VRCEWLVDLHNNTGHNPPFSVVTRLDETRLALTSLFSHLCIHNDLRLGTLIEATEDDFPGVTIECGRAGNPAADVTAFEGLERYLEEEIPSAPTGGDLTVLEKPIRVCIPNGTRLAFAEQAVAGADLTVMGDIDRHNFQLMPPNEPVGWVEDADAWPVVARGADGQDVSRELFGMRGKLLETRQAGVPIMMTTDPVGAASDCLFYLVRPREPHDG
jgi:hypothetical protein